MPRRANTTASKGNGLESPASEEPRSARKADTVAGELMRRIASKELAVGAILPREDELAVQFAVNRSVVREAVKLLEVHRLVRPVRRRGTEVLDPMGSMSPEVLRALLSPRAGQVDLPMLRGLLEVRAQLDEQMSSLAAARCTPDDVNAFRALIARMDAKRNDAAEFSRLSRELPFVVAQATHNPVFQMLAHWNRTIAVDLDELFRLARPPVDAHLQGLSMLVSLLSQHDVEGVRTMVRAFHEWATPRMLAAAELMGSDGGSYPVSLPPTSSKKTPTAPKKNAPSKSRPAPSPAKRHTRKRS
jgi:DNA-binding FadR family transcriptional regulator